MILEAGSSLVLLLPWQTQSERDGAQWTGNLVVAARPSRICAWPSAPDQVLQKRCQVLTDPMWAAGVTSTKSGALAVTGQNALLPSPVHGAAGQAARARSRPLQRTRLPGS